MPSEYQKQRVPTKEKTKEWYSYNGRFYKEQADFLTNDRAVMVELYRAAMGYIDESSYKHVINPFNSAEENLKRFPAKLRNYDIIIPIINLFLGEKSERPFNHRTIVANPDVESKTRDAMEKEFVSVMAQDFVNELNAGGIQTGVPTKKIPTYEQLKKKYSVGIVDERAIISQQALDYLKHNLALKDRFLEGFYDWLVVGRVFTYKDVEYNDVVHEMVPPLELWHGTSRTGFIEDASWVLRRNRYSLNDFVDKFHTDISEYKYSDNEENIIDRLEKKYKNGNTVNSSINSGTAVHLDNENGDNLRAEKDTVENEDGLFEVSHVQWKGLKKVGVLTYQGEYGVEEMEVDEDYKINKEAGDIDIKWDWVSVVHEIYIADDDIYLRGRELPVQRNEISNTSKCKLGYNGRIGYSERNKVTSVVTQLLPYGALSNTIHYRLEMVIAKNKEKIMVLPIGLFPDGPGWTEDKVMYIAEAMGLLLVDETKPNAKIALDGLKSIDMSLGKYVSELIGLIKSIKDDAWDAIGMNRQRYGDVNASDGKGTNEQALVRSSVISREMNRRYERWEETEVQGLIEYSKAAWINGKKGAYLTSDGQQAMLNIDGAMWLDAEVGVFSVDSQEEFAKLKMYKEYAFGYAQKAEVGASVIGEVIDGNNMSRIKEVLSKAEDLKREYEEAVAAKEAENAQMLKQLETQREQQAGQIKLEAEKIKGEYSLEVARIQSEGRDNGEGTEDIADAHNKIADQYIANEQSKLKLGNNALNTVGERRLKEANLQLGHDKLESAERIAKMNKN